MKSVFLIDDDADDREIFAETLLSEHPAINYLEAENGAEAMHKLHSESFPKPDLIFLDLNMPIMDGRVFLRQIKEDKFLQNIPVIIYTTSSSEIDKKFASDNQAVLFLTKQYSIKMLRNDIKEAVDKFLNM